MKKICPKCFKLWPKSRVHSSFPPCECLAGIVSVYELLTDLAKRVAELERELADRKAGAK